MGKELPTETAHKPIESRPQMQIECRPALWRHDRGVECILLQHERDALRGSLVACCQLGMSNFGYTMGLTAPIVTIFAHSAERF